MAKRSMDKQFPVQNYMQSVWSSKKNIQIGSRISKKVSKLILHQKLRFINMTFA